MARGDYLYDDDLDDLYEQPGRYAADPVHREVVGDVQGAADQSAGGYTAPVVDTPAPAVRTATGNPKADWMALVAGLPPSIASIKQVFPQFLAMYPGSSYERADIKGPWGWFDAIGGLGSGDVGQKWQTYSGSSGTSSKTPAIDPSYLAPWTESFRAPAGSELPMYQAPDPFTYQDFEPLTAQDLLKDPGYLFREDRVKGGIENSAAARGLLGSSGTLYDIGSAVSNFAGQEYGAASDRKWNQWLGGFNSSLDAYNANTGVGKDAYSAQTTRANDIYDRAWQVFDDQKNTFFKNQDRPLDRLFTAAGIGSRAF